MAPLFTPYDRVSKPRLEDLEWAIDESDPDSWCANFKLDNFQINLALWGRVRNPLTEARALEIACLKFAKQPSVKEIQQEIDFIEGLPGLNKIDRYRALGEDEGPQHRALPPDSTSLKICSRIAKYVARLTPYDDPVEAYDHFWADDDPWEILAAEFCFDRKALGNPDFLPGWDMALAEIFASAILFPSVLKIWNLYQRVLKDRLTLTDKLHEIVLNYQEAPLQDNPPHIWANEENRLLFGEQRKIEDYFYINAFDLEYDTERVTGKYVIPADQLHVSWTQPVPAYWRTEVKQYFDPDDTIQTEYFTEEALRVLASELNKAQDRETSAWSPSILSSYTTKRVGQHWEDGPRGDVSMVLPQRHEDIPEDQLSSTNLPAFYAKLSCAQAAALAAKVHSLKGLNLPGLLDGDMFDEFWPQDFNADGTLRSDRKCYGKKYVGHLSTVARNGAKLDGKAREPLTEWEKIRPRTYQSMGRYTIKDPEFCFTRHSQLNMLWHEKQRAEAERDQAKNELKRATDNLPEGNGPSKRPRLSKQYEEVNVRRLTAELEQEKLNSKQIEAQWKAKLSQMEAELASNKATISMLRTQVARAEERGLDVLTTRRIPQAIMLDMLFPLLEQMKKQFVEYEKSLPEGQRFDPSAEEREDLIQRVLQGAFKGKIEKDIVFQDPKPADPPVPCLL